MTTLQHDETYYRILLDNIGEMVVVVTAEGEVTYASPATEHVLGYPSDTLLHQNIFTFVHPDDVLATTQRFQLGIEQGGRGGEQDIRARHADGRWRTLQVHAEYLLRHPSIHGVVVTARDVTENRAAAAELRRMTLYDSVTQLPNATLLRDRLQQALLFGETSGHGLAVVLLDIDRFALINETFGHAGGDHLLREVARRLQDNTRVSDTVARFAGDTFAIVLPSANTAARAGRVVEKLRAMLDQPFRLGNHEVNVAVSAGVALSPQHGVTADELLQAAEVAARAALRRHSGMALYAPELRQYTTEQLILHSELRAAISHNELALHFQPKVDLADERTVGVEALVRWQHPQRGLISPDSFIPLAEQTGLMGPLTRWVLGDALRQLRSWSKDDAPLQMVVNLSANSFQDDDLICEIPHLMALCGVDAAQVMLEVTESALMVEPDRAHALLVDLRAAQMRVAIDDFGTGYSSLAYLARLPVDELKIDKSFVLQMAEHARDQAIVRSVIELGHNLGLRVTAEGVEDKRTLNLLRDLGCDYAQGYYVSRPLAEPGLERWLAHHQSSARAAG